MLIPHSKRSNQIKHLLTVGLSQFISSRMNKLVYIYVPNEFLIGQVVLKSFIKRLVVAMVNKTVYIYSDKPYKLAGLQPQGPMSHAYWTVMNTSVLVCSVLNHLYVVRSTLNIYLKKAHLVHENTTSGTKTSYPSHFH
jgi:hypothetical protein